MPKYRVKLTANIFIALEAPTPEAAVNQIESLLEDASVSCPYGEEHLIGVEKAMLFYSGDKPVVTQTLPDTVNLEKANRHPTFNTTMRVLYGFDDDDADDGRQPDDKAPENKDVR